MRVLIVDASSKLGAVGGAQRVAGSLFYELRKRGISTYYLGYKTEYIGNDRNAFFISSGMAQRSVKRSIEGSAFSRLVESVPSRMAYYSLYSLTGIPMNNVESWLAMVKPDIVLSSSIQDYVMLKQLRKHLGGAKLVYIEHANASGAYGSAFDYNILGLTFGTGPFVGLEAARRRFFGFFDGVVALNKEQYRNIKRFNRNVTIIHSAMLMGQGHVDGMALKRVKRRLGVRDGDNVVLYLGRLAEAQKNVSSLILSFKAIKKQGMRLLIVGDGKSRQLYGDMSSDDKRITVTGRVPENMLGCYYSMAGLYVLPSVWESFNATFIEAAHFGAALLLSKKSINEDIAERFGSRLYTFDPSDMAELRRKIERYFSDKRLRTRLRLLSKEIAEEYGKKKQMDSYALALREFNMGGRFPDGASPA